MPARERVPGRQHRRHLEVDRVGWADCREHERLPDRRRERRPRDGDPVHVQHRHLAARVADPDGRLEIRREAAEPGIRVVVGGSCFPSSRAREVGACARAVLHVLLEDLRDRVGNARADHPRSRRFAPTGVGVLLAVTEHDLANRHRLRVDPAGGERRVGRSQIER